MDELLVLARIMGVSIEWEDFLPLGWGGAYWAAHATVYILRGMTRTQTRTVLAHELGHAHYGHAGRSTAEEWQADVWAAKQLLDPAAYLEAARDNPPVDVLARRLGVTEHILRVGGRAARGPSYFGMSQSIKLREGLGTVGTTTPRPPEPRRMTRAFPVVQATPRVTVQPVPRVTVQSIPRELVLA